MSLEEYFVDDLFAPSLSDGSAIPFEQNPSSPDFVLTDSFFDHLFPLCQTKPIENVAIQHQEDKNEDFIPDFDFDLSEFDLDHFTTNDESFDIGAFISETSFQSPIDSSEYSPSSNDGSLIDESTSIIVKRSKLNPHERKLRKKSQNKTAAEKYRLKKKSERDQLADRHSKLKNLNQNLRLEFENLSYRVQQLKQLLVDVVQVPLPESK